MLLKLHREYTKQILEGLIDDSFIKEQIEIGSIANDCCELTDEGQTFIRSKNDIFRLFGLKRRVFGNSAIYQSHFGNLASMHAMSKTPGEAASTTKKELVAWFDFLNDVALGNITIVPNKKIASDNVHISGMFTGGDIEYEQIFDTDNTSKIRYRALGMMLHIIQDAYTDSHCERNANGELVKFFYYNYLSPEDIAQHHVGDKAKDVYKHILSQECKNCVKSILIDKNKYHYTPVITLSSNSQASDHNYKCPSL